MGKPQLQEFRVTSPETNFNQVFSNKMIDATNDIVFSNEKTQNDDSVIYTSQNDNIEVNI